MEFGLLGGREEGEHSDVGFVETSDIFATQDAFFLGTQPSNIVYNFFIHHDRV